MNFAKFFLLLGITSVVILSGCKKEPRPVAMNMYIPSSGEEVSSGITVEVTEDMIKDVKRRMKQ